MFGNKKKNILENGIQARAVIMQVRDTGVTINDNPRVELVLQVQAEGEAPFQASKKVTVSRVRIPTPGSAMWVRYDPADPSRVEFDEARIDAINTAAQALAGGVPTRDALLGAIGQAAAIGATAASSDPLDRLKKLNDLRVAGALTKAEFDAQKAKVLAEG